MLEIKNVFVDFDRPILNDINFNAKKGQIIGLVGKSGAGKSTLLNVIAGQLGPKSGALILNGELLPDAKSMLIPGFEKIKLVSQDYNLDPYHTVEENIREAAISLPKHLKIRRTEQLLKLLKLNEIRNVKANETSGGEQQRLSIARAIALKPEVLLLDEPFSNLDSQLRALLFKHILKLRREENLTIILVSHEGQDVLGLSDVIYFLNKGKMSSKKTPFNAYYQLNHLRNALLLGIVNQISVDKRKIRFRPDEYEISAKGEHMLEFESSLFLGHYYLNYFMGAGDETIILSSTEPFRESFKINIVNKYPKKPI
ncbi:MAG: ABC transporter ATP-binding protein [Crocinitomicaceae bacterium]|jgi:ABC-type multidrug transport system ATPase subunit|tara:strand:+ start:7362 stop:8300 length:939 start_codon:yes stop_codon:yes gene_type:complete